MSKPEETLMSVETTEPATELEQVPFFAGKADRRPSLPAARTRVKAGVERRAKR